MRTLPSGEFASFLPFLLFEYGVVQVTRDGFGDGLRLSTFFFVFQKRLICVVSAAAEESEGERRCGARSN